MTGEKRVKVIEYGQTNIGARVIGIEIKDKIVDYLNQDNSNTCIIDFSGVEYISTGFSRELVGGLIKELGNDFQQKVKIKIPDDNSIIRGIIIKSLRTI